MIIMGVAGSGKTTIGKLLAEKLACPFHDADDFHPAANKEKMGKGIPLTDLDRLPWLRTIAEEMKKWEATNPKTVLACSALKQKYRDLLAKENSVQWVYLKGNMAFIRQRLENRQDHFMKTEMLESQFGDLEEPEEAIVIDINSDSDRMVDEIIVKLKKV